MRILHQAALIVVAVVSLNAQQFEGAISMKATNYADSIRHVDYSILIKGNLAAAKVQDGGPEMEGGRFIFRGDKKVMWIINDEKKQYLEISLRKDMQSAKDAVANVAANAARELHQSGKKQTILGYPCEEWIAKDDDRVATIWATGKLGNVFAGLAEAFGEIGKKDKKEDRWEDELVRMKMFPLTIAMKKSGKPESLQEVTKIEPKSVSASSFDPPAGYAKQSLDEEILNVMKQMQEQMKKMGNDSSGENFDLEKMMKHLKEHGDESDSTDGSR
ncbi:MAG: DUF4412 domain-containing protein [Ignavibacteriae bacterium]|nr:DUF4412 domain-containing protein [Ignavibacteria bacterium]MBI3364188.1 DUF4412 domain-containing protein [Ignavibacteriota bacterium]